MAIVSCLKRQKSTGADHDHGKGSNMAPVLPKGNLSHKTGIALNDETRRGHEKLPGCPRPRRRCPTTGGHLEPELGGACGQAYGRPSPPPNSRRMCAFEQEFTH